MTIRVCIKVGRDSHISLVVLSTPVVGGAALSAGCDGGVACGGGATYGGSTGDDTTYGGAIGSGVAASILVSDPSRGGLSSASPILYL